MENIFDICQCFSLLVLEYIFGVFSFVIHTVQVRLLADELNQASWEHWYSKPRTEKHRPKLKTKDYENIFLYSTNYNKRAFSEFTCEELVCGISGPV